MLNGAEGGNSIISGGMAGSSSQLHCPKSASQIRVKVRARAMPPRSRMNARARVRCTASAASPASLSAK